MLVAPIAAASEMLGSQKLALRRPFRKPLGFSHGVPNFLTHQVYATKTIVFKT